jgi:membrane protease YdiL (CAAX protease family)
MDITAPDQLPARRNTPIWQPPDGGFGGRRADWGLREVAIGIGAYLALFILNPIPIIALAFYDDGSRGFYIVGLISTAIADLGLVVAAASLTWRKFGGGWERLGIQPITGAALGWAAVVIVALWVANLGYIGIIEGLDINALKSSCDDQIPKEIINDNAVKWLIPVIAIGFAPWCEEIFFRGFITTGLARAWGVGLAVLGSALLFSAAHVGPSMHKTIIPILLLGIIMALGYWRSGNIFTTMIAHAVWNIIGVSALLYQGCDS